MSLRTVSARHIRLISVYWTRYAVRSGAGLVFLILGLLFGLGVAQALLAPVEMMIDQEAKAGRATDTQAVVAEFVNFGRPVVEWALSVPSREDGVSRDMAGPTTLPGQPATTAPAGPAAVPPADPWARFLLDEQPALLSAVFLVLMFGMPLLVPFLAFNQVSGDVQSRGLRYVLLRTERASIFFGRYVGTVVFSTLVMIFIVLTITFYLGVRIQVYPAGALVAWGLHGVLSLAVLMLPYIALCAWISASVDSPFLSLFLGVLVIGGVRLLAFIASLTWEPATYLKYTLPWGLQNHLLHPELTHSLGTVLACLGYAAVFLLLGYRRFETRDL